ncbi:MAG: hypothetical protein HKO65_09940 [Gemmatimonadetes bacterium]|nr:hypothetical protein [Gemmatimonadota bacterium]NNM05413.1 hypothetical protein [Gemmatimonadota bacterium]
MSRFAQSLQDADARLSVPEPARSRILLELAADMEDLHREYLDRGLSEAEADREVAEHFDLSDETLKELVQVHDSPLQRSLENLSGQVRGPWSRLLMVALALFVTGASSSLLFRGELYGDASGLVWILMPIMVMGLAVAGGQARRLVQAGDIWSPSLRQGLPRLLGLSAGMMVVAGGGLWLELYRSALRIRAVPREALIHLVGWLHMASATLVIALSGALVLGFLWFFLEAQVRRQELAAAANLLEEVR